MRKRFHLNKWYHWVYYCLLLIISWYKVSYLSIINWIFYCIFTYFLGYKFLSEEILKKFKVMMKWHAILTLTISLYFLIGLFLCLMRNGVEQTMIERLNFNSEIYIFGYQSVFALMLCQLLLNLGLLIVELIIYWNSEMPQYEQVDQNENYTFQQRKTSYLRQQSMMDKIIMLIIVQLCLNDGLVTLFLVLCMLIWLALHFHILNKRTRFRYCQMVIKSIVICSFASLLLLILSGQQNYSFSTLNGTLNIYRIFKIFAIILMTTILILSMRAYHYQLIIGQEEEIEELEKEIQKDMRLKISSFEILLGENYFGVIMILSVFWISKQFSILRGLVYLILLVGQLKRKQYKATRRWQCAIAILYLAFAQFFLLKLFNIPQFKVSAYFQYLGVYEQPQFNPDELFAIWDYFYNRFNVIIIDLFYILIVSWLVYSQQTIDDRRRQKKINDLDTKDRPNREQKPSCWTNFKSNLSSLNYQFQKSFLIHFDEIVIIYSLITALSHADIFRGVFLIFFILYAFAQLQKRRKYMRNHLSIGYIILFILYSMQLMFLGSLSTLNFIFKFGGLDEVTQQFKFSFYFIYKYYDIIIGCVLLTFQIQVIQKTDHYQEYKKKLNDYNLDYLRQILQTNGLIFCQIIALIVAFIPPANLLSLIFIFFFQLFLYLYYIYGQLNIIMDRIYLYWPLMITLTLIILIVRYTYTIKFFYFFVELYFQQPTLLSDFGLDPDFNTLKLVGTGIALLVLCAYERAYLAPPIQKEKQQKQIYKKDTFAYYLYCIYIKVCVYSVYHIQKVTFMFSFFISVYQQSYIGFLFAIMIFLIMLNEMRNNWQNISIPILVIIFIQILIQYIFQAELLRNAQGQETISWIGIENQYQNKYWYLLIMFHLSEMLQVLNVMFKQQVNDYLQLFQITTDREITNLQLLQQLLHSLQQNIIQEQNTNESDASQQQLIEQQGNEEKSQESIFYDEQDDINERFAKIQDYYSQKSNLQQQQFYYKVYPFYRALKFHQSVDNLFTQIGLEVCLFFIVITAYYQRNFFSVFYIVVASAFANRSYLLDRHSKIGNFGQAWGALCILQMLEVIRKYGTLQWTPPSWDVRKPWWYFSYSCNPKGKESFNNDDPDDSTSDFMKCQTDWNYWLSLQGYTNWDLWINFIALLISLCFYRHFKTVQRRQQEQEMNDHLHPHREEIQANVMDKNDFTYEENRTKIMDFIKFFIFCYFYKFALIIFLLIGMSSDIQSYTEVISCIYFFLAINLLYMSEKLEKERNTIWSKLILFNTIVMILMSLYQAPFIKCPIIYENDRYYYDNVECVQIQLNNHYYNSDFFIFLQDEFQLLARQTNDILKKYEGVSTIDVIYMFLSHLLGLNKTLDFRFGFYKETLMAFFFLLGLLQRNIWAHPYMRIYVDPYLQRQQQQQKISAIQLIEGIHLKRIWDFKYVQAQKQVHESLQQRVQNRVEKWDNFFQFDDNNSLKKKSFFYLTPKREEQFQIIQFAEERSEDNQQHTSFDSEKFQGFKGEPKKLIKAEKITQQNKAPVIHLYDACCIVKHSINEKDLKLRLKKLMLLEEKRQLERVYLNDRIGLTNYHVGVIDEIDRKILQVENEIAQLFKVQPLKKSTSMKDIKMIPFEEFQGDRKSFEMLSERDERQQQISEEESAKDFKKSEDDNSDEESKIVQPQKSFSENLKVLIIHILTHDTYIREQEQQQNEIDKKKLSVLIFVFVAHYFQVVCVLLMVINACFNANIIALFYPFSAFLYGLLENPVPSKRYWNFLLIYTIIIISLKFIYQMPIFCDSPPYRFIGFSQEEACEPRVTTQQEKITRIDYVIGIRKYQGIETFMNAIWIELLLFIALLIQRYLLQSQGIWDYMKLSLDKYFIPQFQQQIDDKSSENQQDSVSKQSEQEIDDFSEEHQVQEQQKEQQTIMISIQESFTSIWQQIVKYYYRLFPHALSTIYEQRKHDPTTKQMLLKDGVVLPEQIKVGRDFYAPGFIICLIILVYFLLFYPNIIAKRSYAHITQGQSQRFSSEVIFVLLVVIAIIITDRALFIMRKVTKDPRNDRQNQTGNDIQKYTLMIKVAIHFILIIVVHYYFFFVIPQKTNKRFQESYYLIFAYILVCIYFIISSVQIRYGYPIQKYTQIFTNSHKPANSMAFKIYRMIPFLYELRVIIDWTFTTTALDLIQWFRLEDIFANLYICQAYQDSRIENHKLGYPRSSSDKCLNGCLYSMFIVFIIILPILIFSTLNPAVEINNITNGKFSIKAAFFGQDDKLFFTLFQVNDLELLDIPNEQFKKIQKIYGEIETSWQERMQKVRIKRFSDLEWNLPENYRDQIRNMIKSQEYQVEIQCEWVFQKSDSQGGAKSFTGQSIVQAPDTFVNNFGKILAPRAPDAVFDIKVLVPKFLYVGESAETQALRLEPVNIREEISYYQDIRLIHKKTSEFVFFELVPNDDSTDLKQIGASSQNRVEFFVLNELAFGSLIGALSTNMSIISIYATFVLTIGRFLRFAYDKISTRVMFEEMPETYELFDLCQSIYIARVDGDFFKEEIFYELLIRIYRSPEILFKMTGASIYDRQKK
ncbi:unnamed protein product [Paramecium sonneborni]|uniref:Piezo non-specific cation channel R-Ras-binding domain-containing protein n=1 Tax=Paramecium sonneborni TaxID=65129 RepID=A0A8S1PKC7_9CILI|nr:unnamed protein product [Paramecium sonneborni]